MKTMRMSFVIIFSEEERSKSRVTCQDLNLSYQRHLLADIKRKTADASLLTSASKAGDNFSECKFKEEASCNWDFPRTTQVQTQRTPSMPGQCDEYGAYNQTLQDSTRMSSTDSMAYQEVCATFIGMEL